MARTLYIAKFSNGVEHGAMGRGQPYTHAYLIWGRTGARPPEDRWECHGFSREAGLCKGNMLASSAWLRKQPGYTVEFSEIVVPTTITGEELRDRLK